MDSKSESNEKQFWNWFKNNNPKFFFINQIVDNQEKERLLNEFLKQLHTYDEHLFFEIGGFPHGTQELIITADGDLEQFEKVEHLVSEAPHMKDWRIIAFKPPAESGFTINYMGIKLSPENLWFFPLENKKAPNLFGLKVYLEDYDNRREKEYLTAVYLILDSLLGEKSSAQDIQHVETDQLPSNPEKQGLIELLELPKYIKWKKFKH